MKQGLALFDLDGTITRSDTMFLFLRMVLGPAGLGLLLLWMSPVLFAHKLGFVSAADAKRRLLRAGFKKRTRTELLEAGSRFVDLLDRVVRPAARERLKWHLQRGDEVMIVSASLEIWVSPWAEQQGVKAVCTRPAWRGERFWGFEGANCNGPEKVRRVDEVIDRTTFGTVYAYGDTSGDQPMLAIANEKSFRPFR